ncbi:MAG TPA: Gfo/Idh/MocA family oxidoreductase [Candidatus Hydrogenedentes bacterium]|nr:Gfo/Idh/MocA family oxidoreductase [Candidatus Hydrogenedentota bacterium]
MLRIGLIGYGYWGPHLARNFGAHPECRLVRISDSDGQRRALAASAYPGAEVVGDDSIAKDDDLDVIAIATPVFSHHPLAKTALEYGKHVWLEKPMASTVERARELAALAEARRLTLMVDHTFLFTGAVARMKELIDAGELGDLYYYDSVRINLGLFQHDVNVIWDLAPHDFSIMDHLLGPSAEAISAHGRGHFSTGLEDVAYVTVFYPDNLIAHLHVNWLSPVKIRRTVIGGSKQMLVWDDLNKEEQLKIYDKGMEVTNQEGLYRVLATPRIGDMYAPVVSTAEALATEVGYFVECIQTGGRPINDAVAGARIVSMLEAASQSLREDGRIIPLK